MAEEVKADRPGNGAVIGGWVCMLLGVALMAWTLWSALFYVPLFVVSFILGIVAIAQKRIGNGIAILLLSLMAPILGAAMSMAIEAGSDYSARRSASTKPPAAVSSPAQTPPAVTPAPAEEDLYADQHLELYDFSASYRQAALDGRVPGVTFKLKNAGDRTLERVEVTVYFQNAEGQTIAEERFLPVLVSKYSASGKPLKPGYIWQQERGKFYMAKSVPTEWAEGKATAEITGVRFQPPE